MEKFEFNHKIGFFDEDLNDREQLMDCQVKLKASKGSSTLC